MATKDAAAGACSGPFQCSLSSLPTFDNESDISRPASIPFLRGNYADTKDCLNMTRNGPGLRRNAAPLIGPSHRAAVFVLQRKLGNYFPHPGKEDFPTYQPRGATEPREILGGKLALHCDAGLPHCLCRHDGIMTFDTCHLRSTAWGGFWPTVLESALPRYGNRSHCPTVIQMRN